MATPEVEWSADVGQADWIRARLDPFDSSAATSVVPAGFAAYARVLHPAYDAERPVRWSEVAAHNGLELRSDAQFPEIALLPRAGEETQPSDVIGQPDEGTLTAADATALVDDLRRHTTTPDRCWFCLWDGFGGATGATAYYLRDDEPREWAKPGRFERPEPDDLETPQSGAPPNPIPSHVRDGPRVELPSRTYFLYHGPIEQALAFVESEQQTPNLWWPDDRSWCVASEIDLQWSYVGGSTALVNDIVADGRLEAWRADPRDNHYMQTPAWLTTAIDGVVAQLLAGHQGQVETSRGTVTARLRRPRRLRRGRLWTTSTSPDGSSDGSSWTSLSNRNDEALREEIRHQLMWEVIGLLR